MKKTQNKPYEQPIIFIDHLQEDVLLASAFVIGKEEDWSDEENPWEKMGI